MAPRKILLLLISSSFRVMLEALLERWDLAVAGCAETVQEALKFTSDPALMDTVAVAVLSCNQGNCVLCSPGGELLIKELIARAPRTRVICLVSSKLAYEDSLDKKVVQILLSSETSVTRLVRILKGILSSF